MVRGKKQQNLRYEETRSLCRMYTFFVLSCYSVTQLARQVQQDCTQVVYSNKVSYI